MSERDIWTRAREVFHSNEAAQEWLSTPQWGLGMRVPVDLVGTDAEAEVWDLLGRIEHGVVS